jgi:DNA-binding HxlR family transcriptional regulator
MNMPTPGQPVRGSKSGKPIMALFDLLGRAWAMGIIWQLRGGPYTFRELREKCDNVSPTLLNRRLKELRQAQLVEHGLEGYYLTKLGQTLFEVLEPFERWSKKWARELETADETSI